MRDLKPKHVQRRHPFTLVELMTVIVIAAIVLGFSVPAFRKIMNGNSVDAGSRMVSSQLMLCRGEAVSKRRYVALLLPADNFKADDDDDNIYAYSSLRAAFVKPDTSSSNKFLFDEWVPGTAWAFLPTGAVCAEADNDRAEVDINDDGIVTADTSWATDNPNGTYLENNVKDDTFCKVSDNGASHKMVEGKDNSNIRAIVFKPNGRCHIKTYVTVMEGIFPKTGNDIKDLTRVNMFNFHLMEIPKYTGQVRYLY